MGLDRKMYLEESRKCTLESGGVAQTINMSRVSCVRIHSRLAFYPLFHFSYISPYYLGILFGVRTKEKLVIKLK